MRITLSLLNLRMSGQLGDSRNGYTLGQEQGAKSMAHCVECDPSGIGYSTLANHFLKRPVGRCIVTYM